MTSVAIEASLLKPPKSFSFSPTRFYASESVAFISHSHIFLFLFLSFLLARWIDFLHLFLFTTTILTAYFCLPNSYPVRERRSPVMWGHPSTVMWSVVMVCERKARAHTFESSFSLPTKLSQRCAHIHSFGYEMFNDVVEVRWLFEG